MIIKVCGMRDADNIRAIDDLGVDWLGFIFYPKSPRYVDNVPIILPTNAKRVGVFVNESIETIKSISRQYALDIVQLHGSESPEMCSTLSEEGFKVIKAFSVKDVFPTDLVNSYQHTCQYYLFDTQTKDYGGSGSKFSWGILSDYHGDTPFVLSGGISEDDVEQIYIMDNPQLIGIDINSRFELSPGHKDIEKIEQFIKKIK